MHTLDNCEGGYLIINTLQNLKASFSIAMIIEIKLPSTEITALIIIINLLNFHKLGDLINLKLKIFMNLGNI